MNKASIIRGSVYYIRSTRYKEVGCEEKSGRPAVIVSNNANNNSDLGVVEVCYMTLRDKKNLPTRVNINEGPCYNSTVLCEQITTVSIDRLGDFIAVLNDEDMARVEKAIRYSLELPYSETSATQQKSNGVDNSEYIEQLKGEISYLRRLNDELFKRISGV